MNIHRILLILSILICFNAFADSGRGVESWNRGWFFHRGDLAEPPVSLPTDSSWQRVNLPHDFQISQPWVPPGKDEKADTDNQIANVKSRLSSRGFKEMGTGWYVKPLYVDSAQASKRLLLDFEGIMLTGDIYLNGEKIGGTDYGYLGTEVDLTGKLKPGVDYLIAVRADTGAPENSRWYTGGGLYRDVNLITIADPRHYFTRNPLKITTPIVTDDEAVIVIEGEIASNHRPDSIKVRVNITGPEGNSVYDEVKSIRNYRSQKIREHLIDSISLPSPHRWDIDDPALYTLHLTLLRQDGSMADEVTENFGIRTIEFSPEFGFKLNGRKVTLKGIANHHTLGALGAAAYPSAMEKRIKLLKDFGFNHIRTSHNPYSKSFLDLCDRYGILVVDELYDKWKTQFAGGRKDWTEQWQHDVAEWARRDRNHPSVILWSLGNELQLISDLPFNDWGVTPYRLQKQLLDRYDGTRLSTVAMHPRGRNHFTDSLPAPLALATDIASYNYRYMYFPGDSRRFPNMIFYQSEANTSGMGPNYFDMDLDKVVGLAYWGMIDYLGESHGWPAKGWAQGVFDISLEPKPMAYFLKSFYKEDEPMVRIAIEDSDYNTEWNGVTIGSTSFSSHWNRKEGSKLKLYTFTNADEVELLLNGKSLGKRKNDRSDSSKRNRILWDSIPYSPGVLEAVAYSDASSQPIARHKIETTGPTVKLSATPDNPSWLADGMDLQHIRIAALDAKNRETPGANDLLQFRVEGPAEIVGVINGDINSDELHTATSRHLFDGKATVILRSLPDAGDVTLYITPSEGKLKPLKLKLSTKARSVK